MRKQSYPAGSGSQTPADDVRFLTVAEAAAVISKTGVYARKPHNSTVTRWILKGLHGRRLPAVRLAGCGWRIPEADLQQWVVDLTQTSTGEPLPSVVAARADAEGEALAALLGK
jgi:excisionase family DNA binding protein